MSFLCTQIRPIGKAADEFSYVSTTEEGQLIEEEQDLGLDNYVPARKIIVKKYIAQRRYWDTVAEIEDKLPVDVYITSSRFVVLCKKYDKGGTWYGAPISSLIMTGIERAVASAKRKNKILTGMIRYEWIERILYSRKIKWSENETLCIHYRDAEKTLYRLVIWFNKDIDSSFIANEILHKACLYRLAMNDDKDESEIEFFQKYSAKNIEHNNDPKMMSDISFPSKYYAPMGEKFRPKKNALINYVKGNLIDSGEGLSFQDWKACPNCGFELDKEDAFCSNCGLNLRDQNNSQIQNIVENKCINCGTILSEECKFCPECGTKV